MLENYALKTVIENRLREISPAKDVCPAQKHTTCVKKKVPIDV